VDLEDFEGLIDVRDVVFAQVGDEFGPVELLLVADVAVLGERLIYVFEFLRH
jgi:hypothetical protein